MDRKEYLMKLSRFRRLGTEAEDFVLVLGDGKCTEKVGKAISRKVKARIVLAGLGEFERSMVRFLKVPVIWVYRDDAINLPIGARVEAFPFPQNQIDDALVARTKRQIFVGRSKRIARAKKFAKDLCKKPIWIR